MRGVFNRCVADVDVDTFNWLCGSKLNQGSCRLTASQPFQCMTPVAWPPGASTGSSSCGTQAFACSSSPFTEQVIRYEYHSIPHFYHQPIVRRFVWPA